MEKAWKTIIDGEDRLWNLDIREIWNYRSLIWVLFQKNYSLQYKQTILGPLWMIFSVIINTGVFTLVFGYVGHISSDGIPYFLFCMTGNVIWNLFAFSFNSNIRVLIDNAYLFGKVYFPRLIVPISNSLLCLGRCLMQLVVLLIVLVGFIIKGEVVFTGLNIVWIFPLLLLTAILGTSLGLIISALTVKYRDFEHLTGALVSMLMFVSPVLYPTSSLSPVVKRLLYFNPMSSFVEAFRLCITGTGNLYVPGMIYSIVFTIVITAVALFCMVVSKRII
ncbi:ABC transporter permease [Butyrivibrio sp. AE2032]|uniref:ABC transporter permease n=1 Tax=Butyrivibrio sp. AE2032 TaxID=1458463 RepID=UPI00068C2C22|nr:ABC transporter permease [Butyrivibrio sp. AE2032]